MTRQGKERQEKEREKKKRTLVIIEQQGFLSDTPANAYTIYAVASVADAPGSSAGRQPFINRRTSVFASY
jgi:hypothetical protein